MFALQKYYKYILRTIELMLGQIFGTYVYLNEFCHMCMSYRRDEYEKPEGISESNWVMQTQRVKLSKAMGH